MLDLARCHHGNPDQGDAAIQNDSLQIISRRELGSVFTLTYTMGRVAHRKPPAPTPTYAIYVSPCS